MDKIKSSAAGKSGGVEQASTHLTGTVLRRRINMQMMQNILLIWLDNNIDENSDGCRNTVTQLRRVVNSVNTFTDADECVDFLTDIYSEKVCMIISGALCRNILPQIHEVPQLHTIFIYCENKTEHEQLAKDWPKIKGIFTEISLICEPLRQAVQQCEQNAIPISFMSTSGDVSKKNLDQLDLSFMYTQILKEILLLIEFEQKHIKEFIDHCQEQLAGNDSELNNIKNFETKYRDKTPIWLYSHECFLYSMLNRALRLMNVGIITKMGFFIGDLHRHIEKLHKEQLGWQNFNKSFTVYRGQGMSETEFEQMAKNKGGLISFNNFLSTSMDHDVSLLFAQSNQSNSGLMGILFVMTIDPSKSSTPFASINGVGHFPVEDEVLFSMHTVFRIDEIKPMSENNRLFQVDLTLTNDDDKNLRQLTDRIREETFPDARGWYRLGLVLLKMGQPDKAQHVYEILLEQATEEIDKSSIYHQLGYIKNDQGEYKEAITFYEKGLEIKQRSLPPNYPDLVTSYMNIGVVYNNMGEYSKALSYFEKALEIWQQSLSSNHPDLADCCNNISNVSFNISNVYLNISNVYFNMGEYSKALSSYEKVLQIQQQSLPLNHPSLAGSYNNIGAVYNSMGEYSKALLSYKKALGIQQQSLPPNHPDLTSLYGNIGMVYFNMAEYSKALWSHEKALEIRQQSLHPNHPDLAISYNNIGLVYDEVGEYSKALSYYEKALKIQQQSLPPSHPYLGYFYNNIGAVYYNMGEYSKALSSLDKALEIKQQSLPPNHFSLAGSYNNIGVMYYDMGEYSKALSYYEKALEIEQQSLPPNHPDLGSSYNNIGMVYCNMGEYSKALSYYGKALEIKQQSLPPNHPDLAISYNNIGTMYMNMRNYSKAGSFYQRAMEIGQQSLPSNHPHLQIYGESLDRVNQQL